MNDIEETDETTTKPATPDEPEGEPDADMDAAMSEALAPVVAARASNGAPAAEARPVEEATEMMGSDTVEKPANGAMPTAAAAEPPRAVAMMAGAGERAPSRVFDHLVEGEDDVIGLITYSLYKQDKRDWLAGWKRQHGREPTADEMDAFVSAQLTFAQRDRYRTAARQVLDAYASVAVDLEKPLIIRDGVAGRVETAVQKVEASARWWRQLPAILIGALVSAGIVIAVIAILVAAGADIAGYLGFE